MMLDDDRRLLAKQGMLKTDVARELYRKYYHVLFEVAKDLKNSNVREVRITSDLVIITTASEDVSLKCAEGEMTAALGQLSMAGAESEEQGALVALTKELIAAKAGRNSGVVFFDIGANIGWYSIYLEKLFKGLQIHAFEPVAASYRLLLENLVLNGTQDVRVNNFGLADANKIVDYYVSPSLLAASSLADTFKTDDKTRVRGEVRRLDDYCLANSIVPDLLKCDVEGAELLVFKGAGRTLMEEKPAVMTELLRKWAKFFNYHPNDVIKFFRDLGYSCYALSNGMLVRFETVSDHTSEKNFFFLHDQKHARIVRNLTMRMGSW